jgi:hypothetical protein
MEKHESPELPTDSLPRPVVLRPEDLASVAAAGMSMSLASLGGRILIAGGMPAGPMAAAAF